MKLFIDMDGVLTDFRAAVEKLGEVPAQGLSDEATEVQKQKMYDAIEEAGEEFWSEMPWTEDGKKLWNLVKRFNPTLLTSPGLFAYAESGKNKWVRENMPGTPLFFSNSKSEYAEPFGNTVLIDDMSSNTSAWEEAGGEAILHTNAENTERLLMERIWDVPHVDPTEKYW